MLKKTIIVIPLSVHMPSLFLPRVTCFNHRFKYGIWWF